VRSVVLCSHGKASLNDGCKARDFVRYTIKISLLSILRTRRPHVKAFRRIHEDAIDRFNRIVFEGVKLATFHILRLFRDKKEIPRLHASLFRHCFAAVSRLDPKTPEPTSMAMKDPELAVSVAAYRGTRGGDTFPHREGIVRALELAVNDEMANLQNHVKVHLVSRIERWLTIRLEGELRQEGLVDKDVKEVVKQMVSRVAYDEEKIAAIAMEEESGPPPIPCWEPPGSAEDLLGEELLGRFTKPALEAASLDTIWQVWKTLIDHMGQGKLPLCRTHFNKTNGWKDYFPLMCQMLADVEAADDCQPAVPVAPVDRPAWAWSIREVKKILDGSVPGTVKRKAASELVHSVVRQEPFRRHLKALRTLSKGQLAKLEARARRRSPRSTASHSGPRSISNVGAHTGGSTFSRSTALPPDISPWIPVSCTISTGSCGRAGSTLTLKRGSSSP
jgi:hypothetical protein